MEKPLILHTEKQYKGINMADKKKFMFVRIVAIVRIQKNVKKLIKIVQFN